MSVEVDTEVIVLGAGPAGSTAARTLAEHIVQVIVVDRSRAHSASSLGSKAAQGN